MNKKKKIALAVLLLLLLAGLGTGLALISARRAPLLVVGDLSAKEVAEITSAVHRRMWHDTFPNFSWKTVRQLPGALLKNTTSHISGVYGDHQSALVLVANSKDKPPAAFYALKSPKGWVCAGGF